MPLYTVLRRLRSWSDASVYSIFPDMTSFSPWRESSCSFGRIPEIQRTPFANYTRSILGSQYEACTLFFTRWQSTTESIIPRTGPELTLLSRTHATLANRDKSLNNIDSGRWASKSSLNDNSDVKPVRFRFNKGQECPKPYSDWHMWQTCGGGHPVTDCPFTQAPSDPASSINATPSGRRA